MLILDTSGTGAVLTTCSLGATQAFTGGYYDSTSDTLYFAQNSAVRIEAAKPP